jgi:hypothetical protein
MTDPTPPAEPVAWPDPSRPGYPLNPEQDSAGHVIQLDGDAMPDIYRWDAAHQWFEDRGGRWVAPYDLVKDGDQYHGQIAAPAQAADAKAMREAAAQVAEDNKLHWASKVDPCSPNDPSRRIYSAQSAAAFMIEMDIRALPIPAPSDAVRRAREDAPSRDQIRQAIYRNSHLSVAALDRITDAILALLAKEPGQS